MEWKGAILVPYGGALGVAAEKELNGVDRCLPHCCLVDGEVADVVGLGCSSWVGFEEGVDYLLRGLEGAGRVEGQVSTVVEAGCLLDEDRLLF